MTVYGQPCPPPYDLKRVTIPVATFTSAYDKLIPSQVRILRYYYNIAR